MEPSSAMISAGCTARATTVDGEGWQAQFRQTGRHLADDWPRRSATGRPAAYRRSAQRASGGRSLLSRVGQTTPTTRVTVAMATALRLKSPYRIRPRSESPPTGPPGTTSAPRKGRVCTSMMIMPMPDMNPDITEYGV